MMETTDSKATFISLHEDVAVTFDSPNHRFQYTREFAQARKIVAQIRQTNSEIESNHAFLPLSSTRVNFNVVRNKFVSKRFNYRRIPCGFGDELTTAQEDGCYYQVDRPAVMYKYNHTQIEL